jgi:hypothetical protein
MPKHGFRFNDEVKDAVRRHVRHAIESVDPRRYNQEGAYVPALVRQLEGTAYEGRHGSVVFQGTVYDDRGRNSAERRLGADLAITAIVSSGERTIRKVILVQAKLGELEDLNNREFTRLNEQIEKMKRLVGAPKVMQIPESSNRRHPQIVSGNKVLSGGTYRPTDLEEYFVARVMTTLDGCTDQQIVEVAQSSSFANLHFFARSRGG